jgi:geranylgeranyl diphosphate synthase type II
MDGTTRVEEALSGAIERALLAAISTVETPSAPPRLAAALRYAVFPGGARIRPRLCLAVACSCGDDEPGAADAAAAALEFLHCASLVHDDLPCFDDAPLRRGKPSVHRAFGERLAVLVGDALIVLAFQTLARGLACNPARLAPLLMIISRSVGMPTGIVAGQARECESAVDLAEYQREKTGALFAAATMAGAAAAGADPGPWRTLGEKLGEAFQVADDLHDAVGNPDVLGKPVGRDAALDRPSAVRSLGIDGAIAHLNRLVAEAAASIPPCPGAEGLKELIIMETERFLPRELWPRAA